MATALKLYTADGNLNAITKTISNVNPEASDYTLKDFSVKLMDLSNNDLHKVERVDTKNITTATNSGGSGFAIASSSPFFSTDSDTYVAAFDTLPGVSGSLAISMKFNKGNSSTTITLDLSAAKTVRNLTGLINLINYSAFRNSTGEQRLTASQITNGIHFDPQDGTISDEVSAPTYPIQAIWLKEDSDARSENVAAWLKSVGENLIQVAGYKSEYNGLWGEGTTQSIVLTRL